MIPATSSTAPAAPRARNWQAYFQGSAITSSRELPMPPIGWHQEVRLSDSQQFARMMAHAGSVRKAFWSLEHPRVGARQFSGRKSSSEELISKGLILMINLVDNLVTSL